MYCRRVCNTPFLESPHSLRQEANRYQWEAYLSQVTCLLFHKALLDLYIQICHLVQVT
jgi:hypothetical protein